MIQMDEEKLVFDRKACLAGILKRGIGITNNKEDRLKFLCDNEQ